ncbi:MAG: class I SAM-dependent methyltransferase [bacterium]|nr:class I SAM-dependent methyltransferase [bacterium]
MKKTTSLHSYNADRGLGFFQKFLYLFLNWVNNLRPYHDLDKRIIFKSFGYLDWRKELDNTYATSSVGRRLSDLFWRTLPWGKIQEELGEIHIFDTGCGSGNYGARLMDASGGLISSYTGVDAKEKSNWAELRAMHPNIRLIKSTSSDISSLIPPQTNLFITQSAIEHFDEDIRFFEQIKAFIDRSDKPVVQIHNFPGAAILPLYLFHGIRQYTPRTISKITRIFKDASKTYLYGLGGSAGKRLHFRYFTWPLLILKRKARWSEDIEKYDKEVRKAVEYDTLHPSRSPIFWVLIIHSNAKKKIW